MTPPLSLTSSQDLTISATTLLAHTRLKSPVAGQTTVGHQLLKPRTPSNSAFAWLWPSLALAQVRSPLFYPKVGTNLLLPNPSHSILIPPLTIHPISMTLIYEITSFSRFGFQLRIRPHIVRLIIRSINLQYPSEASSRAHLYVLLPTQRLTSAQMFQLRGSNLLLRVTPRAEPGLR